MISAVAVAASKKWVASAEHNGVNGKPSVHIWNPNSFANVALIQASHRGPIISMAFTNNDEILVTIGIVKPAPLILYHWERKAALISTVIWELPLEIRPRRNEEDNAIEIVTKTKLLSMTFAGATPKFQEYCNTQPNHPQFKAITAGMLIHTNEGRVRVWGKMEVLGVTGHPDGSVVYWSEGKIPTVQGNYKSRITNIEPLTDCFAVSTMAGHIYIVP